MICRHDKYTELEGQLKDGETITRYRCDDCGRVFRNKCEVYSRVVGYLRPIDMWNKGKKEEFRLRKTYKTNNN